MSSRPSSRYPKRKPRATSASLVPVVGPTGPTIVNRETALQILQRVNLLKECNFIAVDIGGTLTKIIYLHRDVEGSGLSSGSATAEGSALLSPKLNANGRKKKLVIDDLSDVNWDRKLAVDVPQLHGTLYFFAFNTVNMDECVKFVANRWLESDMNNKRKQDLERNTSGTTRRRTSIDNSSFHDGVKSNSNSPTGNGGPDCLAVKSPNDVDILKKRNQDLEQHSYNSHSSALVRARDFENKKEATRLVRATGGGSIKYAGLFQDQVGVTLKRMDEMGCTVTGLNFLLTQMDNEVFSYNYDTSRKTQNSNIENKTITKKPPPNMWELPPLDKNRVFLDARADPFPYLLVNIGSGVSIIKVTGHGQYTRVSGTNVGGGTFWGLSRLLTNCKTFDEVIELTTQGNNENVDMLVRDIYGAHGYADIGFHPNVIASSFGKVYMKRQAPESSFSNMWKYLIRAILGSLLLIFDFLLATPGIGNLLKYWEIDKVAHERLANVNLSSHFSAKDVALALLRMVSYNIGQIAYLNATRYNLSKIYFGGNFIRDQPYTIAMISYAIEFFSEGEMKAFFLRHDGYLGALGAFLGNIDDDNPKI